MDDANQSGPDAAFVALYREHSRGVYAHIRTLVPNEQDADEVFQETSTVLWQKFDQYQPNTDFRAWACRIAYYKVLKLRERQHRSPRLFSPEFLESVDEEQIVMSDVLDARSDALIACVEELKPADRDLLWRRHDRGASTKRIASELKQSTASVYRSLRRIYDTLHRCITRRIREDSNS